ncbi:hypothetical protein M569_14117 [Genlisea aurea]|uniref:Uncharacterized protein n=1 Tax=Genlisea aurea TaxID=192259 RepID=S8C8G6_9LAMI|nr:hypothetical protein M569_14117 [Genlisea aurea]
MRSLKRRYLRCSENASESGGGHASSEKVDKSTSLSGSGFKKLKEEPIVDFATEEHTGNQILATEVDGTDANTEMGKSKKKSERLIMKLTRKHREEIQEFCRIWETETLKQEGDHKLEISCVRLMHGQGTMGIGKLKLLEKSFVSRMEEHNRLKALQLKELKAKQLSEIEDARRTAEAQRGAPEYSSRSEDDVGLQLSTSSGNVETGDAGPLPRMAGSAQSQSRNSGAQIGDAVFSPSRSLVDCETPVGKGVSDDLNGDIGVSAVNDHRNQFKSCSENESNVSANIAAPDEFPDEVMADKGCNGSPPEGLASQRDEPEKEGLQNSEQTSHSGLDLPVLEDVDESVAETDNNAAALPEESVAVPHEPNEAENGQLLHSEPTPPSFSSPASGEVRNASRNSEPGAAGGGEPRILESSSVIFGSAAPQISSPPASGEVRNASRNAEPEAAGGGEARILESSSVISESAAPQISFPPAVSFDGSHFPHRYDAPSISADPLRNELDRLNRMTAVLEKNHENTIATLKSECEKEIAQIRDKYALKLRESETEYRSRRDEQDRNMKKVVMSKLLADAFRSKLNVARPYNFTSGIPSNQVTSQSRSGMVFPGVSASSRPQSQQQQQQQQHVRCSFVPNNHQAALRPPPVIGAISPGSYHPRSGPEIRTRAPHLQPTTATRPPSTSAPPIPPPRIIRPPQPPPPLSSLQLPARQGFQSQQHQHQQAHLHFWRRISNAVAAANREMPRVENDGVVCLSDDDE